MCVYVPARGELERGGGASGVALADDAAGDDDDALGRNSGLPVRGGGGEAGVLCMCSQVRSGLNEEEGRAGGGARGDPLALDGGGDVVVPVGGSYKLDRVLLCAGVLISPLRSSSLRTCQYHQCPSVVEFSSQRHFSAAARVLIA